MLSYLNLYKNLHNRVAGDFSHPATTTPIIRGYPEGTSVGRAPGVSQSYQALAEQGANREGMASRLI